MAKSAWRYFLSHCPVFKGRVLWKQGEYGRTNVSCGSDQTTIRDLRWDMGHYTEDEV